MSTKTKKQEVQKLVKPEIKHVYKTQNGIVVGRSNGKKTIVPAREFIAESLEELTKKIEKSFISNTVDYELIFQNVIALGLEIVDIAEVVIDGKVFQNISIHNKIFGDKEFFKDLVDSGEIIDTCPNI